MTSPYRDKDIGLLGTPLENIVVDQVTRLSFGLLGHLNWDAKCWMSVSRIFTKG